MPLIINDLPENKQDFTDIKRRVDADQTPEIGGSRRRIKIRLRDGRPDPRSDNRRGHQSNRALTIAIDRNCVWAREVKNEKLRRILILRSEQERIKKYDKEPQASPMKE